MDTTRAEDNAEQMSLSVSEQVIVLMAREGLLRRWQNLCHRAMAHGHIADDESLAARFPIGWTDDDRSRFDAAVEYVIRRLGPGHYLLSEAQQIQFDVERLESCRRDLLRARRL